MQKKTKTYNGLAANNEAASMNNKAGLPAVMLILEDQQEHYFDALEALSSMEDYELTFLIEDDFGVGAPTDSLVYFYEHTDARIGTLMKKAGSNPDWETSGCVMGYECYVCPDKALAWIKANRPHLVPLAS